MYDDSKVHNFEKSFVFLKLCKFRVALISIKYIIQSKLQAHLRTTKFFDHSSCKTSFHSQLLRFALPVKL